MMIEIKLYDHSTVEKIDWPKTPEAEHMRTYLLPMIQEGVQSYIRNVKTKLFFLQVNTTLIPITVNQKEYENSYLTSNYFPIKYMEEQLNKCSTYLRFLQKLFIRSIGFVLKAIKINKVVIINNWLITTNIYPNLSEEELEAVTNYLSKSFPDHTLIFRSLNTHKCSDLIYSLKKRSYRFLFARKVSIYDPQQKGLFSPKILYHHRRDRRLISTEGYEIVRYTPTHNTKDISDFLKLYKALYHDGHTQYSPQYTEKFLEVAVKKNFLDLVFLKKGREIHGVIGFHERQNTLIAPFCGYDQTKVGASLLYRMLTIVAIDEAEKRKKILNDGSGGELPKKYRGMQSFPEYVALYDKHLPVFRRIFWGLAESLIKWIVHSKINEPCNLENKAFIRNTAAFYLPFN